MFSSEFKQPKKKKKPYQSNDTILLPLPIPMKCPEDINVNKQGLLSDFLYKQNFLNFF